ncbi:hypothetical protein FRB96_007739 [Tulasnella sp. 330]|nr:hypothetical protein FRB96_007739 [Tulasnella sp. 330]KAG8874257.1 hypothetical protein FRB97_006054 [Tulasnella sp. 331]KAG8878947.1 hypothetical protein FRB98_005900 [Tulasnella sp. 332]
MITFHGISTHIRVDRKDLDHFQPEFDENTKTATCWIPSEAGKCYLVSWTQEEDISQDAYISVRMNTDGEKTRSGTITDFKILRCYERAGLTISGHEEMLFPFGGIVLIGDMNQLFPERAEDEGSNGEEEERDRAQKAEILTIETEHRALEGGVNVLEARKKAPAGSPSTKYPLQVKQERGPSQGFFKPGEVIDLTMG